MRINFVFLTILSVLILTACASDADNKKKRIEKVIESNQKVDGKILYHGSNDIYYASKDGLYSINYNLPEQNPVRYYANLDSITIVNYTLTNHNNQLQIKTEEVPLNGYQTNDYNEAEIRELFKNPQTLFKIYYPWLIIGQNFIASLENPYKLYDISYFMDTNKITSGVPSAGKHSLSKDRGSFKIDNKLYLNLKGDRQLLPGFNNYKTRTIPQELWNGEGRNPFIINSYSNHYISPDELNSLATYKYPYDDYFNWNIEIDQSNRDSIKSEIYWGPISIPYSRLSSKNIIHYYQEREKNINAKLEEQLNAASDKLKDIVSKAKIQEEQRLQETMQHIKDEAVNINDIWHAYSNNPIKAEKTYPPGEWMILYTRIDQIKHSNRNFKYELSNRAGSDFGSIYTNETEFTILDYPVKIWIKAYFYGREQSDYSGGLIFTDAKLLLWQDYWQD